MMFGLAFLLMAKKVPAVKDYLTIAVIGVMIISSAFSVTNIRQTFGIAAHSLVLLFFYLFAIGLYYAGNFNISRRSIKAINQEIRQQNLFRFVARAALAENQQEIERKVLE